jgi:hypothetical protein
VATRSPPAGRTCDGRQLGRGLPDHPAGHEGAARAPPSPTAPSVPPATIEASAAPEHGSPWVVGRYGSPPGSQTSLRVSPPASLLAPSRSQERRLANSSDFRAGARNGRGGTLNPGASGRCAVAAAMQLKERDLMEITPRQMNSRNVSAQISYSGRPGYTSGSSGPSSKPVGQRMVTTAWVPESPAKTSQCRTHCESDRK